MVVVMAADLPEQMCTYGLARGTARTSPPMIYYLVTIHQLSVSCVASPTQAMMGAAFLGCICRSSICDFGLETEDSNAVEGARRGQIELGLHLMLCSVAALADVQGSQ